MELRQVEAFVTAATTRSFTRAAAQLRVSQSAVSQQIRLLEEEVGEALFIRSNRNVRLSSVGQDLLPAAQEMLRWRSALLVRTGPNAAHLAGRLTVGTSAAATAYLWARVYQAFARMHPRVEMDIRTMRLTQDTIDHVLSGDLDVGFTPLPLDRPGLDSRLLGVQEAVLAVPAGHRLSSTAPVAAREIARERFILYEPEMSIRWLSDRFFRRERIAPEVVLESNDTHLIKAMVEVGFGIAFLPSWSVEREVTERRLRVLDVQGQRLIQSLGVLFRRSGVSPVARVFAEFCAGNRDLLPRACQAAGL